MNYFVVLLCVILLSKGEAIVSVNIGFIQNIVSDGEGFLYTLASWKENPNQMNIFRINATSFEVTLLANTTCVRYLKKTSFK
jgi:hypothetical protein